MGCVESTTTASKMRIFTWRANIESDLAGYNLYHEKEFIANIPDPSAIRFKILVNELREGINIFNMTAYDLSGNESGFSGDAIYTYESIIKQ